MQQHRDHSPREAFIVLNDRKERSPQPHLPQEARFCDCGGPTTSTAVLAISHLYRFFSSLFPSPRGVLSSTSLKGFCTLLNPWFSDDSQRG